MTAYELYQEIINPYDCYPEAYSQKSAAPNINSNIDFNNEGAISSYVKEYTYNKYGVLLSDELAWKIEATAIAVDQLYRASPSEIVPVWARKDYFDIVNPLAETGLSNNYFEKLNLDLLRDKNFQEDGIFTDSLEIGEFAIGDIECSLHVAPGQECNSLTLEIYTPAAWPDKSVVIEDIQRLRGGSGDYHMSHHIIEAPSKEMSEYEFAQRLEATLDSYIISNPSLIRNYYSSLQEENPYDLKPRQPSVITKEKVGMLASKKKLSVSEIKEFVAYYKAASDNSNKNLVKEMIRDGLTDSRIKMVMEEIHPSDMTERISKLIHSAKQEMHHGKKQIIQRQMFK